MPTYEYRCPEGHEFEHFYRTISSAEADLPCPTCGKLAHRKVSGGAVLLFKGSGFYITDYGKDGKKDQRSARRDSSESAASSSGESGKESSSGSGKAESAGSEKSSGGEKGSGGEKSTGSEKRESKKPGNSE